MSAFRSIEQNWQVLWMCSFLLLSPKLLAQQKVMIRTAADVETVLQRDSCSTRDHNLCLCSFFCSLRPLNAEIVQEEAGSTLAACSQAGSRSPWVNPWDQREGAALLNSLCHPEAMKNSAVLPCGSLCGWSLWPLDDPLYELACIPRCLWRNHAAEGTIPRYFSGCNLVWCCLSFLPAIPAPTRLEGEIELWAHSWLPSPRTIHIFALKKCKWKPNLSLLFTCLWNLTGNYLNLFVTSWASCDSSVSPQ